MSPLNNGGTQTGTPTFGPTPGVLLASTRPDLCARLSEAQRGVLHYLLEGMTEPQIAQKIGRSRHTIHDHTKAIYANLGVSSRVQLVLLFSQPMPMVQTPAMRVEAPR